MLPGSLDVGVGVGIVVGIGVIVDVGIIVDVAVGIGVNVAVGVIVVNVVDFGVGVAVLGVAVFDVGVAVFGVAVADGIGVLLVQFLVGIQQYFIPKSHSLIYLLLITLQKLSLLFDIQYVSLYPHAAVGIQIRLVHLGVGFDGVLVRFIVEVGVFVEVGVLVEVDVDVQVGVFVEV